MRLVVKSTAFRQLVTLGMVRWGRGYLLDAHPIFPIFDILQDSANQIHSPPRLSSWCALGSTTYSRRSRACQRAQYRGTSPSCTMSSERCGTLKSNFFGCLSQSLHHGLQVYQPLELLLFIAALCLLADTFMPSLVSVSRVRLCNNAHCFLSLPSHSFFLLEIGSCVSVGKDYHVH